MDDLNGLLESVVAQISAVNDDDDAAELEAQQAARNFLYENADNLKAALRAEGLLRERLDWLLHEINERADVRDGSDRRQLPNAEAQLLFDYCQRFLGTQP